MGATEDPKPLCRETLREIERFLDGALDQTVEVRIQHHLSDCNPCMHRAEFRRRVKVMISEKCTEREVPQGLSTRIHELLRDTNR